MWKRAGDWHTNSRPREHSGNHPQCSKETEGPQEWYPAHSYIFKETVYCLIYSDKLSISQYILWWTWFMLVWTSMKYTELSDRPLDWWVMIRIFFCTGTGRRELERSLWICAKPVLSCPSRPSINLLNLQYPSQGLINLQYQGPLRAPHRLNLRVHPLRGTGRLLHHCITMCSTKSCTYSVLYPGLWLVCQGISQFVLGWTKYILVSRYISVYTRSN